MKEKEQKPAGSWRNKQKAQIQRAILKTSLRLFEEKGFEKTTIRMIAEKAGIGVGTLFNHFPDKSSLLVAVLIDELDRKQEEAFSTMPADGTVRDGLLHIAGTFYAYYAEKPELSRTLLKEMGFVPGKWGDALGRHAFEFISKVADIFRQGQEKGEIVKETDCDLAGMAFFSHYLNALFLGLSEAEFHVEEALGLLDLVLTQMYDGIGVK